MDKSQSPYKGFNSFERQVVAVKKQRLNPPIRGSIDDMTGYPCKTSMYISYQSPYKGFNSCK